MTLSLAQAPAHLSSEPAAAAFDLGSGQAATTATGAGAGAGAGPKDEAWEDSAATVSIAGASQDGGMPGSGNMWGDAGAAGAPQRRRRRFSSGSTDALETADAREHIPGEHIPGEHPSAGWALPQAGPFASAPAPAPAGRQPLAPRPDLDLFVAELHRHGQKVKELSVPGPEELRQADDHMRIYPRKDDPGSDSHHNIRAWLHWCKDSLKLPFAFVAAAARVSKAVLS